MVSLTSGAHPLADVAGPDTASVPADEHRRDRDALAPILAAGAIALWLLGFIGATSGELTTFIRDALAIGASLIALSIALRATQLATGPVGRYRRYLVVATLLWSALQVTRVVGHVTIPTTAFVVELALLGGIAIVTVLMWRVAFHRRFSLSEARSIYLDAAIIFFTIAGITILVLSRAVGDRTDLLPLMANTVVFAGIIGALAVIYLAANPVAGLHGWVIVGMGLPLVAAGMIWALLANSVGQVVIGAELATAMGVAITAYGAATWTAAVHPDDARRRRYERIRSALPIATATLAPVLLVLNHVLTPLRGDLAGILVDGAIGMVLTLVILRQSLLLRERSRLVDEAQASIDRERAAVAGLTLSDQRFRSLVRNSSDVILILADDGTITYQSEAVQRVLGYAPGARIGRSMFEIIHPEDIAAARAVFQELIRSPGMVRSLEGRARHADGSWRTVEASGWNSARRPGVGGIVINYRDITERKDARAAARSTRRSTIR